MKIRLISIGNKPPKWINEGFQEYCKRLPGSCSLELVEIAVEKLASNPEEIKKKEAQKILSQLIETHYIIALDVKGQHWSTEKLAINLESWLQDGRDIDIMMGGANGLDQKCLKRANTIWSLSTLTFPHMLVRVIVAEQIYRAHSIIQKHPYHKF